MSVFDRIKQRSNNNHANNFASILELRYAGTGAKIIEQITEGEQATAFIVRDNVLEIASYLPLERNERFRAPVSFIIETYPLSNIEKVLEEFEEHSTRERIDYLSMNTTILFKDGKSIKIDDTVGMYSSTYHEFNEDFVEFIKTLKGKL